MGSTRKLIRDEGPTSCWGTFLRAKILLYHYRSRNLHEVSSFSYGFLFIIKTLPVALLGRRAMPATAPVLCRPSSIVLK